MPPIEFQSAEMVVFGCFVERICWLAYSLTLELGGLVFGLYVEVFSQEDKTCPILIVYYS